MYKVFIYNKELFVISNTDRVRFLGSISSVYDGHKNFSLWFDKFLKSPDKQAVVYAFNPMDVLDFLKKDGLRCIKAAGGIILNKQNEVLLIKRRGKWDLPKGKMDPGETHRETALREVEEECGVKCEILPKDIYVTYHTYKDKEKDVIKETFWYPMICENYDVLVPQLDEGITKLDFFDFATADEKLMNSFGNIVKLWAQFKIDRDEIISV